MKGGFKKSGTIWQTESYLNQQKFFTYDSLLDSPGTVMFTRYPESQGAKPGEFQIDICFHN